MWLHYLMRGCSPRLGSGGRFPNPIRAVQQSPQLLFAIQQAFTATILASTHEQIEREKARIISPMKEQVSELRTPELIQRTNFSIDNGRGVWQTSGDQLL
jgi:hypothetical protein